MEREKRGTDIERRVCIYRGFRSGGGKVNLHILKRAEFLIKKRLKLIYAGVCLTHCTF